MKPTTKILLLFLAVIMSLIFTSCEKDLYEDAIKENSKFKYEVLRGFNAQKSFYKLKQKLNKKEESTLDTRNRIFDFNIGTISYDEVIKVVDSLGKENYTFEVLHPLTSDTKFFNLVLQEKDNLYVIKLLEYTMTEEFSNQYKINHDLTNFKGTLISYTIYNETPCPEPNLLINIGEVPMNSNIGGGSGDNSGIPSSGPGIGDNSGHGTGGNLTVMLLALDWSIIDPSSSNNNSGENQLQHHIILWRTSETINTNNENSEPVDPCANNTQIGVLAPVDKCSKTFLEGLRNEERMWLYNHNDIHNELMDFISKSANCEEANTLANDIITQCIIYSNTFPSIKPFLIEKQIDDSQLDDCSKGILNKLKQNHAIAKIIARFDNPSTPFSINFSQIPNLLNPSGQSVFGNTSATPTNYVYDIKLNSNYFKNDGATKLGKATTIVHEMIHALIMSVIQNSGNPNNTDLTDFPEIWNEYVVQKTGSNNESNHITIANHYVNVIASALQEFITNTPVTNDSQIEQIYKDLSWSGLFRPGQPSPFDSTILTPQYRVQVNSRKNAEMLNTEYNGVNPSNNPSCQN